LAGDILSFAPCGNSIVAKHSSNMNNAFSLSLVERDLHGDYLSVWNYPKVELSIQNLVEKLVENSNGQFLYTRVKQEWIYVLSCDIHNDEVVRAASLGLVSDSFNPEKFFAILNVLLKQYVDTSGEPVKILEAYLSFMTQQKFGTLSLTDDEFFDEKIFLNVSSMKNLWVDFGYDAIILFNAVLLKKRILVVGDTITNLLNVIRTLPQFVLHRGVGPFSDAAFSLLRPIVLESSQMQLDDLSQAGVYIAGTLDPRLTTHKNIKYDIVVSLSERRITIASEAENDMRMCSFHKEVANHIVSITNIEESKSINTTNIDIINSLNEFTLKAIKQIQTLGSNGIAEIKNSSTSQFLQRLAASEGLLSIDADATVEESI
jgi:hypothetical protein